MNKKLNIRNRTLFYSFLALICYSLASIATMTWSFLTFAVIGGIAELLFWLGLSSKKSSDRK